MRRRQFLTGLLATPLIVPASRLMALPRRRVIVPATATGIATLMEAAAARRRLIEQRWLADLRMYQGTLMALNQE